jgi:hypothetical protein
MFRHVIADVPKVLALQGAQDGHGAPPTVFTMRSNAHMVMGGRSHIGEQSKDTTYTKVASQPLTTCKERDATNEAV